MIPYEQYLVAHKITQGFEGGAAFTDDPDDPGGATKYGISLRKARKLYPILDLDLDNDGDVDEDDIKLLTEEDAEHFFYQAFWTPLQLPDYSNSVLAGKIYDVGVNQGLRQVTRNIQRAVNSYLGGAVLEVDGIYGANTHRNIQKMPAVIVPILRSEQLSVYRWIWDKKPSMKKYKNGWTRRSYY